MALFVSRFIILSLIVLFISCVLIFVPINCANSSPLLEWQNINEGDYTAFEENKQSILQWIASLLAMAGIGGSDTNPEPPEPIDQAKCKPCNCGVTNKNIRIVGGQETEVNEYPWMALLMYRGQFYCGGTLINHWYILTAAHCVSGFKKSRIRVRLLEHDQKIDNETEIIERGVQQVIRHERYSTSTLDNDIALIKMDEEVDVYDELMPACLPPLKKTFAGETGIVTGWGVKMQVKVRSLLNRASISATLQELEVPIISNAECRKTGYMSKQITDNMLCAGFKDGGKDSCQGDSGGPLHVRQGQNHLIVGVVSWGQGCARPNYPGVYCRVNRYLPWIEKFTADACQCKHTSEGTPVEEDVDENLLSSLKSDIATTTDIAITTVTTATDTKVTTDTVTTDKVDESDTTV